MPYSGLFTDCSPLSLYSVRSVHEYSCFTCCHFVLWLVSLYLAGVFVPRAKRVCVVVVS